MKRFRSESGFTLIELMVGLGLSLVVVMMVYRVFAMQQRSLGVQEQINYMNQNSRSTMNFLVRKVRNAGLDPTESNKFSITDSNFSNAAAPSATSLYFTMDSDGNGSVDFNSDERVGFRWDSASGELQIAEIDDGTGAVSSWTPIAQNVTGFSVTFLDETGAATATYTDIRQINISLTCQTEKSDPRYTPNAGHRTITSTSTVRPRNLGIHLS